MWESKVLCFKKFSFSNLCGILWRYYFACYKFKYNILIPLFSITTFLWQHGLVEIVQCLQIMLSKLHGQEQFPSACPWTWYIHNSLPTTHKSYDLLWARAVSFHMVFVQVIENESVHNVSRTDTFHAPCKIYNRFWTWNINSHRYFQPIKGHLCFYRTKYNEISKNCDTSSIPTLEINMLM